MDRGQQNDWFSATETCVEAVVMVMALIYFVAHTALTRADKSFLDHRLLKNGNYVTGLLFIFIVGLVLYATRALTPTMLENLMGYPVATTGLVTAPSGLGTMLAMLIAGRLIGRVDLRALLFTGFALSAVALWQMTHYTLVLSESDIVWPGVLQGIGVGFVFVPLSAAAFSTMNPAMRAQGTAIFSLVRNVGSSIGISLVQTVLQRNEVAVHASMAERITYANPAWANPAVASAFDVGTAGGVNDFRLMLYLTLAVIPLLLIIKTPRRPVTSLEAHTVME